MKRKIFVVFSSLIFVGAVFIGACDKPYLPWNSGVIWPSNDESTGQETSSQQQVEQTSIEDFCRDNQEDVERYRQYLEPGYNWQLPESEIERRKKNLQKFINQFDERCGDQTQ